jgi:DNA-damage-inducible protein J
MTQTAYVRARIDEKTRDEAAEVLAHFGLTVSDVVRMALKRVAQDKAVPFELKVPNAKTRAAMDEADEIIRARRGRYADDEGFDATDKKTGRHQENQSSTSSRLRA